MKALALFVLVSFSIALAVGQPQSGSPVTAEMRVAANDAFQKQDWKAAVAAYEKIVKAEDKNAGARYRYGVSLLGAGSNVEAQTQLQNVFAASPNPVFGLALARAYARNNAKTKFTRLWRSVLRLAASRPIRSVARLILRLSRLKESLSTS